MRISALKALNAQHSLFKNANAPRLLACVYIQSLSRAMSEESESPSKPRSKRSKRRESEQPIELPSPQRNKKANVDYPISTATAADLFSKLTWKELGPSNQVNLNYSLQCGQSFAWRQIQESFYCGSIDGVAYLCRQSEDTAFYHCLADSCEADKAERALKAYFQLDTCLVSLYQTWSAADKRLAAIAACVPGVRVLQQPPFECLISFICSSNNNIARITQMLDKLRIHYGNHLTTFQGLDLHSFPTLTQLSKATEAELRAMGFGYRAKFIVQSCAKLEELGGEAYLLALRNKTAVEVRTALIQLAGIGPKVADCIALFSLDQTDVIPVDTHVWQIALRDYDSSLSEAKSLTPKVYQRVGELFRSRFGKHAGWAHSLLFAAELPLFASLLPSALVKEMAAFKQKEKDLKAEKKRLKQAVKTKKALLATQADGSE
eukprot:TRINITY_DN10425_c0_g1_i4.p1 TRINITY_DN10425_c0_g1~~TRINITY_DN10425_c0_g1_i4.p1  ORF type:complete len:434 (+),score=82.35 TRINITY_DN10425_c0_g1_i4:144-1445(+)